MTLKNQHLSAYRTNGFNSVQGWCSEHLFTTLDLLNELPFNQRGGVCEIGVHHGKFYILLNQLSDAASKSFAVDVFDLQHLNIDKSGGGKRVAFEKNLAAHDRHGGRNTQIIQGDSTDPALRLVSAIGPGTLRFVSVDGGHTPEHTLNDLQLASEIISNEGVVILDDVMNFHWPGVIEGVARFLMSCPTLVPFAIGHNKLYLSKLSFHQAYFDAFKACTLASKQVRFFGNSVVAL